MKATCIKYNNTLDNYREKDKSHVFKILQYRIDQWRQNFNSNCIACADDRCTWIVGRGLEDFVENVYKNLLDDYLDDYIEITLSDLWITNYQSTNLLRNYIK